MPSSSPSIYPTQVRFKSKGKPENVCQLMALMEQKTSFGNSTSQEHEWVKIYFDTQAGTVRIIVYKIDIFHFSDSPVVIHKIKNFRTFHIVEKFFQQSLKFSQQQTVAIGLDRKHGWLLTKYDSTMGALCFHHGHSPFLYSVLIERSAINVWSLIS